MIAKSKKLLQKGWILVVVSTLALLGGATLNPVYSTAQAHERQYLVAGHKNALPNPAAIAKAGGIWKGEIQSLGVAIVRSSNPDFLNLVRRHRSVSLASSDVEMKIPEIEISSEEAGELATALDQRSLLEGQNVSGEVPNDLFYVTQHAHYVMDIPSAHSRNFLGQNVTIFMVDSGIDCGHPDFMRDDGSTPFVKNISFVPLDPLSCTQDSDCPLLPDRENHPAASTCDPIQHRCLLADGSPGYESACDPTNTHGTTVAGITSAQCNNGIGICGIAPAADIVNVKLSSSEGGFPTSRYLEVFDWIVNVGVPLHKGRIMNLSNGSFHFEPIDVHIYGILNRGINLVHKADVAIFAGAGNDIVNVSQDESYKSWPSEYSPHTVTVGSIGTCNVAVDGDVLNDDYDQLAGYSNYGFDPNKNRYLVMPGGQLPRFCIPFPDNRACQVGSLVIPCRLLNQIVTLTRHDVGSGIFRGMTVSGSTSAATPHASALAALLLSRMPDLSAAQLAEAMLGTGSLGIDLTEDIGEPGYDPLFGYGRGSAALIPLNL